MINRDIAMQFNAASIKISGYFFVFVLLFVFSSAGAREDGKLELWFEYDGHPINLDDEPNVLCFTRTTRQLVGCALYRSDDGRYWIAQPAPGKYLLRVSVNENRENGPQQAGDLYREIPFLVDKTTTGPLLVSLQRLLALEQPVDSRYAVAGISADCKDKAHYNAALFALSSGARLGFAWEAYENGIQYHYKLWSVRCSDGMRIERLFLRKTQDNHIQITVPPNEPGEYYQFEVSAVRNAQAVTQLGLFDGHGGYLEGYPFIVSDPLGDRSWLLYLLAAVLLLLFIYFAWVVLRGISRLPVENAGHGSGRLGWLALVVLVIVVTGYLQREMLGGWLQRGSEQASASLTAIQNLYQADTGEASDKAVPAKVRDRGKVESAHAPQGIWQGVIVSTGDKAFIGTGRRAELRITFAGQGGEVAWLDGSKWVVLDGDGFDARLAGSGMTLFGHWRDGEISELWTINIPDFAASSVQVLMDRMVSRRDAEGRVISTRRYQANGELYPLLP